MRVTLTFDTLALFPEPARTLFEHYFRDELTATDAAAAMHWNRDIFNRHLAGIFSEALQGDGTRATLTIHPPPRKSFMDDIRNSLNRPRQEP
jgi:hypothetical protein